MTDGPRKDESPRIRLQGCLDRTPFPLPDDVDLDRTAKRLARDTEALSLAGASVTVHLLSSFLTDYLVDHLILMFARRGMAANIRQGEYGVIAGAILDDANSLHSDPPDLILILPSFRDLAFCPPMGASVEQAAHAVDQEVQFWTNLWSALSVPVIQLSFDTPPYRPLAEADGMIPGGLSHYARGVNMELAAQVPLSVTLVDAESLARKAGLANWHDAHVYNLCKQPFSMAALPHVADALSATAAGIRGLGRKALVVDLDDTLWGGVVGDDGVVNLELGPETPEGEAFTAFQMYLAQLRQRGIILAVCSKNVDEVARGPFQMHPAMVLKEDDFACFVANFDDKPSNLRRIAAELNLGLDALVFVDDNPVERALMRRELPQVMTIEMPENPALYATAVDACRAFPMARLTADDLRRADSYTARANTGKAMAAASDMDGFLASLEARAIMEPVGPGTQVRMAQLLAKTNQFKLNPSVFSAEELQDRRDHVIALRLVDRLQDYGIVAVAVLDPATDASGTWTVCNWVMSCRVFARRLEFVMMAEIVQRARNGGAQALELTYRPSDRNGLIADLLPKLGFIPLDDDDRFALPVQQQAENIYSAHHMEIVRPDE